MVTHIKEEITNYITLTRRNKRAWLGGMVYSGSGEEKVEVILDHPIVLASKEVFKE